MKCVKLIGVCLFLLSSVFLITGCETHIAPKEISLEEAEQIALAKLPDAYVALGDQRLDYGRLVYIFLVQNDSSAKRVMVDAKTARVIEVLDRTDDLRQTIANGEALDVPITMKAREAAQAAALKAAPGFIRKWHVLQQDGHLMYKFKIQNGGDVETRVIVDGDSNNILSISQEEILE